MEQCRGSERSTVPLVLGALTALARPLPITALARMLELDEEVLRMVLGMFYPVIPVVNDMVHPYHSSWNRSPPSLPRGNLRTPCSIPHVQQSCTNSSSYTTRSITREMMSPTPMNHLRSPLSALLMIALYVPGGWTSVTLFNPSFHDSCKPALYSQVT